MSKFKLTYTGASGDQVKFGGGRDPRGLLVEGQEYEVESVEVHSWHTEIKLVGFDGYFNSVLLEDTRQMLSEEIEGIELERS